MLLAAVCALTLGADPAGAQVPAATGALAAKDEIARNGITRIVLVNGHGGNTNFLRYFCQAQLAQRRIYALYLFEPSADAETSAAVKALRRTAMDMHAGETETSTIMAHRPDLARPERAKDQSGADQARLDGLKDVYTAWLWSGRLKARFHTRQPGLVKRCDGSRGDF